MSEKTKEILAELGLFGLTLPRYLHIPMMTSPPATDLLNIQFTVMDMLVDDPEIASVVANHWNLTFEIRAFNVQNQVWDLLELDGNIELPARASIQIKIKNNEPEDQPSMDPEPVFTSKRDPRRKHSTPVPEPKIVSKRDPRRKHRDLENEPHSRFGNDLSRESDLIVQEPSKQFIPSKRDPRKRSQAVVAELEAAKIVAKPIVNKEPNIKNLSKNDPRRKRLLEKHQSGLSTPYSPSLPSPGIVQTSEKSTKEPSKHDHDSDSDEGNLQIDESFDEKRHGGSAETVKHHKPKTKHVQKPVEPVRIHESQLADSAETTGSRKTENKSGGMDDVGLWDEIYGVTSDKKDSSMNIYDPSPAPAPAAPKPNVKQLAKSIGLDTFKDSKSSKLIQPPSSPKRVVNISNDGDLTVSVTPEKKKKSPVLMSPGGLEIDLSESAKEIEIIEDDKSTKSKKRKSIEQLEKERELLLSLVKERDRMNEIVASVPLPDEIIIDREIEEGELSDSPTNSEIEKTPFTSRKKEDFYSPESPKGLQIDIDTEESEIDIIPLEREEVLLKHKKYTSKKKTYAKTKSEEEDSDIEEIPLELSIKGVSKTKQKIVNIDEIEDPDKYKKYWEEFPEDVHDKSKHNSDKDLKSGLKKLSDMKSKGKKGSKNKNPNWALKSVVKTLTESKSEENVPSQNFWKGSSGLSSYSEKIRQKVQERLSSKEKDQIVENPFFISETEDLSEIALPPIQQPFLKKVDVPLPPPLRKGVALLDTPIFPPPVSVSKPDFPPAPTKPGVFNSSIPPPTPNFGFRPPPNSSFPIPHADTSVPPPLVIPPFPQPSPLFPPPLSGIGLPPFSSPPPTIDTSKTFGAFDSNKPPGNTQISTNKVPSLLTMNIPRPSSLEPESKSKGGAWLDPLLPQGRQRNIQEGGFKDSDSVSSGTFSKRRYSTERRSRSRDRDGMTRRRRSGERSKRERSSEKDKRSSERDRRRRSRTRSRSRERRRQRGARRASQDSNNSQDNGFRSQEIKDRRKDSKDEKKKEQTKAAAAVDKKNNAQNDSDKKESQEDRDNLMLCFYEGEDCMDDPGDPDLEHLKPSVDITNQKEPENKSAGEEMRKRSEEASTSKPTASFGLASCLSSLIEDRESKQLFPEPVPAISAGGQKALSASTVSSTASLAKAVESVTSTPAPPAPPSISGNAPPHLMEPPNRGDVYRASLGLANKHPVSAVYEYSNRMKFPNPWFEERWGPGGGWAYDVTLGPNTYSSPWFKAKKRDAKMEACRYALQQLGIFTKQN
eukprot:GFUD01025544.1.p1 GENE.GFUD01025544.1~~GFUD01025544.1.p1  ORF type:complete len:1276 (+),score=369.77 GFUD01025544.1:68-3895(+)